MHRQKHTYQQQQQQKTTTITVHAKVHESEYLSTSDEYNETIARDTRNENTLFEYLTK